jgi:hypothetical protein
MGRPSIARCCLQPCRPQPPGPCCSPLRPALPCPSLPSFLSLSLLPPPRYAVDSLRQLSMKFLERDELANYTFQVGRG